MIKPEQIPDEAAESDYITQWDWHKPLRATPTATNALPGTGHYHRNEQIARLTAENAKLRAALRAVMDDLTLIGENHWLPIGLLNDVIYVNARAALEGA